MKPLLIIDEPSVEALERKAHAGLASAILGRGGPWLRHFMRIPGRHLRFEVFAPRAAEQRIRAFLQKQVALGSATSPARAEYKFLPTEGQHVLKVFDRRDPAAAGGDAPGRPGRLYGILSGRGARQSAEGDALRQTVLAEMTRALDRLTGPAATEIGGRIHIDLLHEPERWLPVARDLAEPLSRRAAERVQIFHGRPAEVRISVTQPTGTQPLGSDGEKLRAAWVDASPVVPSQSVIQARAHCEITPPIAMHAPDPDSTLVIASARADEAGRALCLRVVGPKGTATVPLPLRGRVVLSRPCLGAAVEAVGADARLLPRAEERCPVLELLLGEARLVAGGEYPRFAAVGGQPLRLGAVTVPATMRLGAESNGPDGAPSAMVRLERA